MRCNLLGHWVTLDISPERSNNFEKSQLMAEIETRMKYMEPDGDGKKMPMEFWVTCAVI